MGEKRPSTDYRALTSLKVAHLGAHGGSDKNRFSFGNRFFLTGWEINRDLLAMLCTRNWLSIHWDVLFVKRRLFSVSVSGYILLTQLVITFCTLQRQELWELSWRKIPNSIALFTCRVMKHVTYSGVCWKDKISITFPSKGGIPSFVQTARNLILLMKAADLSKFYELIKSTRDTVHFPPV